MRKIIWVALILSISNLALAQKDTAKLLVGFPITSYMVDLNDSTKVVQIVPGGLWEIKDKQLGVTRGVYRDGKADSAANGWGACHLIKGEYYYFTIHAEGGRKPELQAGDLLYTFIKMPDQYIGRLTKIAAHYITLKRVTGESFFNRGDVFLAWNQQKEEALLDSMVADIHFTGDYFKKNNPSMNQQIKSGDFKDKMLFETMMIIGRKDVGDFLDFVIARPGKYAGNEWKISETFATWLINGAPIALKD